MDWYTASSNTRPAATDTTSSKVFNYVRRNITEQTVTDEGETRTAFVYEEAKIPKDAMVIYDEQAEALDDVYAALTELAEIIAGE